MVKYGQVELMKFLFRPPFYSAISQLNEKALWETQTLRAGCSKAEPKIVVPPPKFNQLEMVTTFTYKTSLVRIDARNFELSW